MAANGSADVIANWRPQLTRAVVASTIRTSIEWDDFLLYSIVTGLVSAKLYLPNSDPLVGQLQASLIYGVGFVARPASCLAMRRSGSRARSS